MEEVKNLVFRKTLIHINKGNPLFARESKGNPTTRLIFDPSKLLISQKIKILCDDYSSRFMILNENDGKTLISYSVA